MTINDTIDREEIGDSLYFTVVASDGGDPSLNTSLEITATILDTNDNDPEFVDFISPLNISEVPFIFCLLARSGTVMILLHANLLCKDALVID